MAKHTTSIESGRDGNKAKADEPLSERASAPVSSEQEEIERLAYSYWLDRGCPHGSPEDDWFRAETEIRNRAGRVPA